MAKYTIELRKIQAEFYAAMQDYPIFDESYREGLNDRIYHACKNREIGYETIEMFIEQLKEWMDLYMPEFNRQYIANSIELTPLQRATIIEKFSQTTHRKEDNINTHNDSRTTHIDDATDTTDDTLVVGQRGNRNVVSEQVNTTDVSQTIDETHNTEESKGTTDNYGYASDFPQDELDNPPDSKYYTTGQNGHAESEGTVENNGNSTSNSNDTTNQSTSRTTNDDGTSRDESKSKGNRDRDYDESMSKEGRNVDDFTHDGTNNYTRERTGTPAYSDFELLEQYRKSFVNVDNLIIRGLKKELFMNIW